MTQLPTRLSKSHEHARNTFKVYKGLRKWNYGESPKGQKTDAVLLSRAGG